MAASMAVATPGYGGFAPMAPAARLARLDIHPPIALMDTNPPGRSTGPEIAGRVAEAALGSVPLAGAALGVTLVTAPLGLENAIVEVTCSLLGSLGLSGGDLVFVRESAEDLFPADPMPGEVDLRRPGVSLSGCELAEGPVWPDGVVVAQVLGEHPSQMVLVGDQHPAGAFAAQGTDHPFAYRVRSRRLRWAGKNPHPCRREHGVEGAGELPCTIPEQELDRSQACAGVCPCSKAFRTLAMVAGWSGSLSESGKPPVCPLNRSSAAHRTFLGSATAAVSSATLRRRCRLTTNRSTSIRRWIRPDRGSSMMVGPGSVIRLCCNLAASQ
jgi:hypothetical protein